MKNTFRIKMEIITKEFCYLELEHIYRDMVRRKMSYFGNSEELTKIANKIAEKAEKYGYDTEVDFNAKDLNALYAIPLHLNYSLSDNIIAIDNFASLLFDTCRYSKG